MNDFVQVEMFPDATIAATVLRRGGDVDGAVKKRALRIANRARTLAPSASGFLRRSIKVEQSREETGRFSFGYRVTATAPYSLFVHEGRAAGSKMPPEAPIARWVALRGLPPSAVFPIRRAIGARGIKARPFLSDALRQEGI